MHADPLNSVLLKRNVEQYEKSCLVVTAHGVAESLVSYNLRLSFQEGLKSLLHCLQLLFVELREKGKKERHVTIRFITAIKSYWVNP